MHKRIILIIVVSVVVLLGAAGGVYAIARRAAASDGKTPQYWAKAKATKATEACLGANDKLNISSSERSAIEMSALSYLIDVPAGTDVDVKLTTYSPTRVTGSDYYPSTYGTYNFELTKQSDGWRVASFTRCHS